VGDARHERLAGAIRLQLVDRDGGLLRAGSAERRVQRASAVEHRVVHEMHAGRQRRGDVEERGGARHVGDAHGHPAFNPLGNDDVDLRPRDARHVRLAFSDANGRKRVRAGQEALAADRDTSTGNDPQRRNSSDRGGGRQPAYYVSSSETFQ
jgi:hypothetical protein